MPVSLSLVLAAGPVLAQEGPTTTADPQSQKGEIDGKRQKVEAELGELQKSDVELKAELGRLEARQRELEGAVADARSQHDQAEADLARLEGEVAEAQRMADESRRRAAERAVAAYMRPERETATDMLAARDPQQLGRMHVLISQVSEFDHNVMLDREAAEQLLRMRQAQADEARARSAEATAAAERDLAELDQIHDEKAKVQADLEASIDDLRNEAAALNAQEAQLTSLIAQREAEARAATTTTTTTAPTTTTTAAPTTTRPGAPPTTPAPTTTTTKAPTTTTTVVGGPGAGSLSWPTSGVVTSPFGPRWGTFHRGIDIGAPLGNPIVAAAAGTVFFSGVMDGYGNVILVDHGNGLVTLYGHQSQLIAGVGQKVSRGQTIGLVGSTGHSTGPHLHFEVRINGVAVDPMPYLG